MEKRDVATDEPVTLDQPVTAGRPVTPTAAATRPGPSARLWRLLRPRRRWCWGTRLVVAATTLWSLFLVTHLLVSGRTPLWTPAEAAPPLLFVAVPVALLVVAPLARPARWRIMAVLLVVALLGGGRSGINLATLWYTPPPAPPNAFKLVAWNTEFWDQDWSTEGGGAVDSARFYRYLRELDADIYLLQEYLHLRMADGQPGVSLRVDALPRLRAEFPGYHIAVGGEQITLSRFPIVDHRALDLTRWLPDDLADVPPELAEFPASYTVETLRTDIELDGRVVSFYNAHVHQPPHEWWVFRGADRAANRYNDARRQASYRALRSDVEANPNPVVIGADLNSSPAMGIRRLLPADLVDHTRVLPSLYPTSWAAETLEYWRVDWLLSTDDVAVHSYEMPSPARLSDHRPQRAVVSLDS